MIFHIQPLEPSRHSFNHPTLRQQPNPNRLRNFRAQKSIASFSSAGLLISSFDAKFSGTTCSDRKPRGEFPKYTSLSSAVHSSKNLALRSSSVTFLNA